MNIGEPDELMKEGVHGHFVGGVEHGAGSYRHAQRLVEQGAYEEAQMLFKSLGDYGESAQWVQECTYRWGLDEYEKLLEIQDYGEICNIGEHTLALFRGISEHMYAAEMIERTSSYLYTMAIQAFNTASLTYNQPIQPGEGEAEENGETDETTAPDIQAGQAQSVFDDARRLFSILEGYQESGRYLELLSVIMDTPQEQVGNSLLTMWDFEPVRKFLLGRYLPDFFRGKWIGEGYDITFDNETYRYYLLALESEQNYGSGTILKKSKKGWEMAYSFRILDENKIEIIGKKEYALQRVNEQTNSDGDSEEIAANSV